MVINDAAAFVDYWKGIRQRTRRLLPLVPEELIESAAAPGRWTFGDLFRHLGGIERWMYAENVQGLPSRYPGHARELASGSRSIADYLDRCHAESCEIFSALTPERLAGKSLTPAGTPITTFKWLRAMVEHEAHHRGQIYLMLGMQGIAVPQLFGLTEEEVKARSSPA